MNTERYPILPAPKYTETVTYIPSTTLSVGLPLPLVAAHPLDVVRRHFDTFSEKHYAQPIAPLAFGEHKFTDENFQANVLRLLIKDEKSVTINIPKELEMLRGFIFNCCRNYMQLFPDIFSTYIYLTARTATETNFYKNSGTWHVDGFQGARVKRHNPEINFLWSNCYPTEFLLKGFDLTTFDYTKYNINSYFRDFANNSKMDVFKCKENYIYMMDPYMIHRSPLCDFDRKRIFIRLTFSPVEIEDPTNTVNPMLYRVFPSRVDVRDNLLDFKG